jgi:hypothetical protein
MKLRGASGRPRLGRGRQYGRPLCRAEKRMFEAIHGQGATHVKDALEAT